MIQNRWTQVEAVFKAGNCDIPAVEHQLGAFLQSGFDSAHHRRLISRCFIADTETVSYGQHFLKIICLACPTTAVNFMVITFFQAIGKKVPAALPVPSSQGQSGRGVHADSEPCRRRFRHRMGNALCRLDRVCDLRGADRTAAQAPAGGLNV